MEMRVHAFNKQSNSILRITAANKMIMRLVYFASIHNVVGVSLHDNRKLISRLPMKEMKKERSKRRRKKTVTSRHIIIS